MNTKFLMTSSSLILGAVGVFALFMPEMLLSESGETGALLVQLMGGSFFAFALMNWIAKDSAIGGIYARPVSLANFSHFFTGAMILIKYLFNEFSLLVLVLTLVYVIYALCFYWLAFRATGLK